MTHGLSNGFLYTAKRIITIWDTAKGTVENAGTGFFVQKENTLYLITNRHVAELTYSHPEYMGATLKECRCEGYENMSEDFTPTIYTSIKIENHGDFVFHSNPNNDIACLKNPKYVKGTSGTITLPIDYALLATKDILDTKVTVCDTIAYPGFPDWYDRKNNTPIFRMGTIASDPRVGYAVNAGDPDSDQIAYEGFSSSGASGSPVFAIQKGFKTGPGISVPDDFYRPVLLIGINSGHFPSKEGHSGISLFYKSSAIIETIESCK